MGAEFLTCDVCGQESAVGVAASGIGPFSIAWGRKCLDNDAEPIWAVETLLDMNQGPDNCNDNFLDNTKVFMDNDYITVREFAKTWKQAEETL